MALNLADMAPMPSNSVARPQESSSPPPANITSCRPKAICCAAMPTQCAEVLQAEVIEKLMPLMANAVDRLADTVEPMQRVTW